MLLIHKLLIGFQDNAHSDHICLLRKELYGLKQTPRTLFDTFSDFFLHYGFFCSVVDPSLFVYRHNGHAISLLLYVDDIVLIGTSTMLLDQLVRDLNNSMKDLGNLHYFLGIEVTRTSDGIFLSEKKNHDSGLLDRELMIQCKSVATPMPSKQPSFKNGDKIYDNPTHFRSLVGALQYITYTNRPFLCC